MMPRYFWLFALLPLTACSTPTTPRVHVSISVDWEGRDLSAINLNAFRTLRKAHPNVPLTHFLNAAYFTKRDANATRVQADIRKALSLGDELGLHIHPWQSLVEAAGVNFRTKPTIWGNGRPMRRGRRDAGHEVSVEAYTTDEFEAIVRKSKTLLAANGFEIGHSFRAGAWLAGPRVREAIRRVGFLVDSSATDTAWHDEIADTGLPAMIKKIWPTVTRQTQPFLVETAAGMIFEMPDTGALADYVTAQEMSDHVDEAVNLIQNNQDRYVHIGFHQETAARYLPRVTAAIRTIKAKHGSLVVFETLETSAQHARQNNSTLQSNGHGPQQLSNLRFALAILPPDQDRGSSGW